MRPTTTTAETWSIARSTTTAMRARVVSRAFAMRRAGGAREAREGTEAAAMSPQSRGVARARLDARIASSARASSSSSVGSLASRLARTRGDARAWTPPRARRASTFASGGATETSVDDDVAARGEDDQMDPCDARAHPEECVSSKGGNWGESSGRASATPPARESIEGEVFRPRERLKTNADFDRVKREGRSFNGAHVRIRAVGNEDYEPATCTRVGIVVPKKQLKRAVDRNLIKRRVRHIFRTNKDKWPPRVDFIVFVQSSALEGGFNGLRDDMFAWSEEYVKRESQRRNAKDHKDAKRRRGAKFRDDA